MAGTVQLHEAPHLVPQPKLPRWNFWRCTTCGGFLVGVDIDDGATPMRLACKSMPGAADRGTGHCPGEMHSGWYADPANWPEQVPRVPHAVFYKPGHYQREQMRKKYPMLYRHVINGGLVWRAPDKRTPKFPTGGTGYGS
jgi:hypothetical protein